MGHDSRPEIDHAPRHDPYRYWAVGIFVELGTFWAFTLFLIAVTLLVVALSRI